MSTVVASMSEILRVAPWSLRALGYSFGIAERAARLLIWAEAVHGQMLRSLRTCEAQIARSTALPGIARTRTDNCGWQVDAGGKHLFEVGPPAIDLLTCDVRSQNAGHVTLANATGNGLLAALCDLIARRGIGCMAIYHAASNDAVPGDMPRSGWLAALPSAGGTVFWRGTEPEIGMIWPFLRALSVSSNESSHLRNSADVERLPGVSLTGYIRLSGFAMTGGDIACDAPDGFQRADYAERVAAAYRHGVSVDLADLTHLYELEKRTWAPTSERSRAQAGFGKF